jgi:SAM-dependent methyltransferase
MMEPRTRWGARAAALYTDTYAAHYRAHDDAIRDGGTVARLDEWLGGICRGFERPIDVLDLGCGTGRYFHALTNVRRLVAIDVSAAMLERARQPVGGMAADAVTFVEGDFLTHEFEAGEFELVYSIGVLAEHSPFDDVIAGRVARWLRPGGVFAFTAVHAESPSIPRTLKRRVAQSAAAAKGMPSPVRDALKRKLTAGGLYADETRVREVLERAGFIVERIEPFESDVHLHLLTSARRP